MDILYALPVVGWHEHQVHTLFSGLFHHAGEVSIPADDGAEPAVRRIHSLQDAVAFASAFEHVPTVFDMSQDHVTARVDNVDSVLGR